ncbi:MAG: hypothetical protein ACR5K7_01905 [Symbiopectobacterium sp.]
MSSQYPQEKTRRWHPPLPSPIPFVLINPITTAFINRTNGSLRHVNIKLDKTRRFTEALRLRDEAVKYGLKIMIGCMASTSLAMAPAFIVAHGLI